MTSSFAFLSLAPPPGSEAELSPVRQVDGFPSRDEADEACLRYAAMLKDNNLTERFGVFVERIPHAGWGVFLRDRQIDLVGTRKRAANKPRTTNDLQVTTVWERRAAARRAAASS